MVSSRRRGRRARTSYEAAPRATTPYDVRRRPTNARPTPADSIARTSTYYGGSMPARHVVDTEETADLLRLVRQIASDELAPRAAEAEAEEAFPRDVFRLLGRTGLLGLPYGEEYGGGGTTYADYLRVLEEIGAVWASVGVGVSVHALSC